MGVARMSLDEVMRNMEASRARHEERARSEQPALTALERRPRGNRTTVIHSGRSAYRAAVQSRLLGDWTPSILAPDEELKPDFRTLRARSRELFRSEPLIGSYVNLMLSNVLGPEGPTLKPPPGAAGELIAQKWQAWGRGPVTADGRMDFNTFQQVQLQTTIVDGEGFTRRLTGRDFRHGTALQGVDGDLVDETMNLLGGRGGSEIRMGVEVDELGRRLRYHAWDRPEYEPGAGGGGRKIYDADELLHHFRTARANQTRGVPWAAAVMIDLNHASRYVEAAVIAARVGASQMGFITWKDPADAPASFDPEGGGAQAQNGDGGSGSTVDSSGTTVMVRNNDLEADPGIVRELEPGQGFQDWSPNHPNDRFADFMKAVHRRIAARLGVEAHALTSDYESVTYSSAREAKLVAQELYRMIQDWWVFTFLQPIYERWLRNAILSGELEIPIEGWDSYVDVVWIPRGWSWVDPKNDLEATEIELRLGLTSRSRILAAQGENLREIIEERKLEKEMFEDAGIPIDQPAPGAAAPPDKPGSEKPSAKESADDEGRAHRNGTTNRIPAAVH